MRAEIVDYLAQEALKKAEFVDLILKFNKFRKRYI